MPKVEEQITAFYQGKTAIGGELCSQPTLSRMENTADRNLIWELSHWWADRYVKRLSPQREEVVIDIDSTDDPTHGAQQLFLFHGYYGQHQYDELFYIDGQSGEVILPVLRPGNSHTARWSVHILRILVEKIRARFPEMRIVIRADAGYSSPSFYKLASSHNLEFCLGLISNAQLKAEVAEVQQAVTNDLISKNERHQRFTSPFLYQAGSWEHPQRVYAKVESTGKALNTRFFVSNIEQKTGED